MAVGGALLLGAPARALPLLQLDIGGGTYDGATETIVATSSSFDLYALIDTRSSKYAAATTTGTSGFFLAAAITPQGTPLTAPFGSFTITRGSTTTTYSLASGNMAYGTPPVDSQDIDSAEAYSALTDWSVPEYSKDLQSHSIYNTSFAQIAFNFSTGNKASAYNVQNTPGGFTPSPTGPLLYEKFSVDISGLSPGYTVHFDLFKLKANGTDIMYFAPFSHDAESGPGHEVGEGGTTLVLIGAVLMVLAGLRSWRR